MATYYVDTLMGSDSNNGLSPGVGAWKTLSFAESSSADGDTVNVADGTYNEINYLNSTKSITWEASGVVIVKSTGSSRVVLFRGAATPVFNGNFRFDGQSAYSAIETYTDASNEKLLNGCTITNGGTYSISVSSGTVRVVNGDIYQTPATMGFLQAGSGCLEISSSSIDFSGTNIRTYEGSSGYVILEGCEISGVGDGDVVLLYKQGTGNATIQNSANIYLSGATSTQILKDATTSSGNFVFSDNSSVAIYCGSSPLDIARGQYLTGYTVERNSVQVNNDIGDKYCFKTIDVQNVNIEQNEVDLLSTGSGSAIHVSSTGTAVSGTVDGNTINTRCVSGYGVIIGDDANPGVGSDKIAISCNNNTVFGPLYFNQSLDPASVTIHGIIIGYQKDCDVNRCFVNGCAYGSVLKGSGQDYASVSGVTNSVFVDCLSNQAVRTKGVKNALLANNTCFVNQGKATPCVFYCTINEASHDGDGTIIKNNIVVADTSANIIQTDADSATGLTSDHNVFYNGGTLLFLIDSTEYSGLSAWKIAGYDANSQSVDPLFVDAETEDYRLSSGSQCVGAGEIIAGYFDQETPVTDYNGDVVHFTPNIGAVDGRSVKVLTEDYTPTGYEVRGTEASPAILQVAAQNVAIDLTGLTFDETVQVQARGKTFSLITDKANHTVRAKGGGGGGMGLGL